MAEPIEMLFGMMSGLGPRNSVLRGGDDLWRGRSNFWVKHAHASNTPNNCEFDWSKPQGLMLDCKRWAGLLSAAKCRGGIAHSGWSLISTIALLLLWLLVLSVVWSFLLYGCMLVILQVESSNVLIHGFLYVVLFSVCVCSIECSWWILIQHTVSECVWLGFGLFINSNDFGYWSWRADIVTVRPDNHRGGHLPDYHINILHQSPLRINSGNWLAKFTYKITIKLVRVFIRL